jgi:hypothetical protein
VSGDGLPAVVLCDARSHTHERFVTEVTTASRFDLSRAQMLALLRAVSMLGGPRRGEGRGGSAIRGKGGYCYGTCRGFRVNTLTSGGWITAAQAMTLITLANTL